jgi:hypothetical protein
MSDEARVFKPMVNHNFMGGYYHKIINHRLGDNGPYYKVLDREPEGSRLVI